MVSSSPSTVDSQSVTDVDETTALLAVSKADPSTLPDEAALLRQTQSSRENQEDDDDKPLPTGQIFLLCYARLVEPIAFFSIFPFINKMIWETGGLNEADVGFYSGLIVRQLNHVYSESLFSLTQMLLMISWGHAADRIGRKPVLVFSLAGIAIATALFGFSKTIWQLILFRCLAGVFAGSVVYVLYLSDPLSQLTAVFLSCIRSMITENSTPRTQARAFSFFAFTGNIGIFLGPLLGGALASPAEQYPHVFGGIYFFEEFPYAVPTIFVGFISASAAVTSWLFLKETLDPESLKRSSSDPPMSTPELVKSPGVSVVLLLYGHIMLLAFAYTAVCPVFYFTAVSLGGYGFSPLQISLFMALAGFSQAIWILIAFPPLQRRFGTGGVLRGCAVAWPILFFVAALGNFFLRQDWKLTFWIVGPTAMALGSGVSMAFTAIQLALNDVSPSPTTLGTLNALALTLISGIRAVAPAAFASLFAFGARTQILDGYLVWLVQIILALALLPLLRWLPAKAEGKLKPPRSSE
ncbi:hypothetical protein MMC27_006363 [Xylographa pallens]|nr:hypothetical protein [Xylographa pallens]